MVLFYDMVAKTYSTKVNKPQQLDIRNINFHQSETYVFYIKKTLQTLCIKNFKEQAAFLNVC